MTSWKTPSPEEVDKAVALLVHSEHRRYFFDRLENPNWLVPLRKKGVFDAPPPAVRDEKKGTIGFPPWAQSRYLARMAPLAPEVVLETILLVPDTDNTRVLEDFIDAAFALPPHLAVKIVPKAKAWLETPPFIRLPRMLGEFLEHLARGGESRAAVDLARSLLAVLPDPRPPIPIDEEKGTFFSPGPRARFDIWQYGEILKKNIPKVIEEAKGEAHSMLCDLLQDALRLSRSPTGKRGPEDFSQAWRPAIEEHGQNLNKDVKEMLVGAVRDASESLAASDPRWVVVLVRSFRARRSRIFLRLAQHLLRIHPDAAPELLRETLSSSGLFNRARLWHEYALLLKVGFRRLPTGDQARILGWVAKGPDLRLFRERYERFIGRPANDDEAVQYSKVWQRDHLALISEDLPEAWKLKYSKLVQELGPPEFPEFASYMSGGGFGFQSPKAEKDLAELSLSELVAFLRSWEPAPDLLGASPEGLGRELESLVAKNPERFANAAPQFQGLAPTYVRSVLAGLHAAAKEKVPFPWPPVLTLCGWVMSQERSLPGRKKDFPERDPDWGWTRTAIVRLLSTGMEAEPGLIPPELRGTLWEVLRPITDDPEPSPEEEVRYGAPNLDPVTLSINTTRGEAMHAVIRYALWVRRQVERASDGPARLALGFNEMPEVREVLERHLEPNNDSSLAIRAVYGRWIPWLVLLDTSWVKKQLGRMFPAEEALRGFRDACWGTYLVSCGPYDNVFDILAQEYKNGADRVGTEPALWDHLGHPSERLAEHLMAFYWRGKLSLEDPEGILAQFYSKAPDSICGRAFVFVGLSLRNTTEVIPKSVLDRLQALWASRLGIARTSGSPSHHTAEMAAFGWWFASGKFDDMWSIGQLVEALRLTGKVEVDHLVAERLADLAEKNPAEVVECLSLMVQGDKEGWAIEGWRAHARAVLATALRSDDAKAKQLANALVNHLGKLGHFDFRDLLTMTSS